MSGSRRLAVASLVVLAAVSLGVVVEAERNYATVAAADDSTAAVDRVAVDEDVTVTVRVYNSMRRPLRVEYATVDLSHAEGGGGSSTPYGGRRTLPPGNGTLTVTVPARLVDGSLSAGDSLTVGGVVAVRVYNGYRFEIPIDAREVTA